MPQHIKRVNAAGTLMQPAAYFVGPHLRAGFALAYGNGLARHIDIKVTIIGGRTSNWMSGRAILTDIPPTTGSIFRRRAPGNICRQRRHSVPGYTGPETLEKNYFELIESPPDRCKPGVPLVRFADTQVTFIP